MESDIYWDGLLKICSLYRENKDVIMKLIKSSLVVVSILNSVYYYLVSIGEIDPAESKDRKEIAVYLINLI
jgi:hypothetical protein